MTLKAGFLNKSSSLAAALGVTKFIAIITTNKSHSVVRLKSDLDVQTTEAGLLNKSSCLAQALGVTKFIIVKDMILVTLCCATEVGLRCSTKPPLTS